MNKTISYNDIVKCFDNENWDFSYLTGEEIIEVLNHPIKFNKNYVNQIKLNGRDFDENTIFLVVLYHSYDFDYTLQKLFPEHICHLNLLYKKFDCNFKYAAVKAGLGRYAKNSLVHHDKFDFDFHIGVFLLFDNIINLPVRNKSNFNLLDSCLNCEDCIKACPVSAIKINEEQRTWIDLECCDNFCHFGTHPTIPSIKWNLVKYNNLSLSNEQIYNIKSFPDWVRVVGDDGAFLSLNGRNSFAIFPICRECTSQKRCTKYNGKYPYDWNKIKIIPK